MVIFTCKLHQERKTGREGKREEGRQGGVGHEERLRKKDSRKESFCEGVGHTARHVGS